MKFLRNVGSALTILSSQSVDGHQGGETEPKNAPARQQITKQEFCPLVRQRVQGLHDENLERRDMIEGRTPAPSAVFSGNCRFQRGPEHLEINHRRYSLKAIAFCGNLR